MLRCGLGDLEKSTSQQSCLRLICIRMMARRVVAWMQTNTGRPRGHRNDPSDYGNDDMSDDGAAG